MPVSGSSRRFLFEWRTRVDPSLFIAVEETHYSCLGRKTKNPGLGSSVESEICVTTSGSLVLTMLSTEQVIYFIWQITSSFTSLWEHTKFLDVEVPMNSLKYCLHGSVLRALVPKTISGWLSFFFSFFFFSQHC